MTKHYAQVLLLSKVLRLSFPSSYINLTSIFIFVVLAKMFSSLSLLYILSCDLKRKVGKCIGQNIVIKNNNNEKHLE